MSTDWTAVSLGDVVLSLGGLWGKADPTPGYVAVLAIRGTDFARGRANDLSTVPRRFVDPKALEKRRLDAGCVLIEASGGSKDQPVGRCSSSARFISTRRSTQCRRRASARS